MNDKKDVLVRVLSFMVRKQN